MHGTSVLKIIVELLDWFRMKQTKMYVCTLEEFILVEIWIHYCTKLNDEVNKHWKNAGLYTLATKDWLL